MMDKSPGTTTTTTMEDGGIVAASSCISAADERRIKFFLDKRIDSVIITLDSSIHRSYNPSRL
jgi:hypothetical protein